LNLFDLKFDLVFTRFTDFVNVFYFVFEITKPSDHVRFCREGFCVEFHNFDFDFDFDFDFERREF
tara:strand:- start:1051 stop:1245 length:195 start_codon:yes stop_codon:yes gene_type:complete